MSDLERLNIEERNAKCHICGIELSIIENLLFGNRCIFCASDFKNIGLIEYLAHCIQDWRIYQVITRLWKLKGKEDAKMLLLGCLSVMGKININEVQALRDKIKLYKLIRGCK